MVKPLLELLMASTFMKQRSYLSGVEAAGEFFCWLFLSKYTVSDRNDRKVDIANFMSQLSQDKFPQFGHSS